MTFDFRGFDLKNDFRERLKENRRGSSYTRVLFERRNEQNMKNKFIYYYSSDERGILF